MTLKLRLLIFTPFEIFYSDNSQVLNCYGTMNRSKRIFSTSTEFEFYKICLRDTTTAGKIKSLRSKIGPRICQLII